MKNWFRLILLLLLTGNVVAQRDLTPGKKRDAFGKTDYRMLRNYGLQVQFGPTLGLSKKINTLYTADPTTDGFRGTYTHDPTVRMGFYIEAGLAHFPTKQSKLSQKLKKAIISYYDWGIGYKHLGGKEITTIDYMDVDGNIVSTEEGKGKFYNGYLYGRFSIHKNFHFSEMFYLDNGLGVNLDYRIVNGSRDYSGAVLPTTQYFHKPFVAQLHYSLGLGIRLNRGKYLIPGVLAPIVGFYEWNKGNPSLKWFSSKYYPLYPHIKFIYVFEKKSKGCPPVHLNDEDKNTNKNR